MFLVTPKARSYLIKYLKENEQYKVIAVKVKKTGCAGYEAYIEALPKSEGIGLFAYGINFIIDKDFFSIFKTSTLDYKDGFEFSSPEITTFCGKSFSVV